MWLCDPWYSLYRQNRQNTKIQKVDKIYFYLNQNNCTATFFDVFQEIGHIRHAGFLFQLRINLRLYYYLVLKLENNIANYFLIHSNRFSLFNIQLLKLNFINV